MPNDYVLNKFPTTGARFRYSVVVVNDELGEFEFNPNVSSALATIEDVKKAVEAQVTANLFLRGVDFSPAEVQGVVETLAMLTLRDHPGLRKSLLSTVGEKLGGTVEMTYIELPGDGHKVRYLFYLVPFIKQAVTAMAPIAGIDVSRLNPTQSIENGKWTLSAQLSERFSGILNGDEMSELIKFVIEQLFLPGVRG